MSVKYSPVVPGNKIHKVKVEENVREFLDGLGKRLGFEREEDWYKLKEKNIPSKKIAKFGDILLKYGGSMCKMLNATYPHHRWLFWKFAQEAGASGIWDLKENQKEFLDWLGNELGFKTKQDYFQLTREDIRNHAGRSLLAKYRGSPTRLLMSIYPTIWLESLDSSPSKEPIIQKSPKEFLDWLATQLGFSRMEDWYQITVDTIRNYGGRSILSKFGSSRTKMLSSVYPEHHWLTWKFTNISNLFWDIMENQMEFMDWIGELFGFKKMEDWYGISVKDILEKGGCFLLGKYKFSPYKLLTSIYRDHHWIKPKEIWNEQNNQRQFFDWLGIELGFKSMEDWYNINAKDISHRGGDILLAMYADSPSKAVMSVYPEHKWMIWRFGSSFLLKKGEKHELMDWLGKELKVDSLEEWYNISWTQIYEKISPKFFKNNPLEHMLQESYPEHQWDVTKIQSKNFGRIRASQRILTKAVKEIFPNSDIFENYVHENSIREYTGRKLEVDIYLPKEHLAFEYQGEQHYFDVYHLGNLVIQKERDREKRKMCLDQGITLIEVPYWWDFQKPSLTATIHRYAPNLISSKGEGEPIPIEPPAGFPKGDPSVVSNDPLEGPVPELMHAEEWDQVQNLHGWWMSEKFDGVRAFWTGEKLVSRQAKEISCPAWFIEGFPKEVKLDGELWMGRGQFENTVPILNSQSDQAWKSIRLMIFDMVEFNLTYEARYEELKKLKLPSWTSVVDIKRCLGNSDLMSELNKIVKEGGEGIVVTKPDSLYVSERTKNRLKVKLYHDSEAQLLEVVTLGFYCLQTNGKECLVNWNSNAFEDPPQIGSVIILKHSGCYANGTLRHASYWRQREDIQWDTISQQKRVLFPLANWTKPDNIKKFFDHLTIGIGCLQLEDLYRLTPQDIADHGGKGMLQYLFDGSLLSALKFVYPKHNWIPWKFEFLPPGFWNEMENQKQYLGWLGRELKFKDREDWYKISLEDLKNTGGKGLVARYGSCIKILTATYPDHYWSKEKFEPKKSLRKSTTK